MNRSLHSIPPRHRLALGAVLVLVIGCERGERTSRERVSVETAASGAIVDSALPMPELLARLQARAGARVDSFRSASPSRDALIRRFVLALARSDTLDLARSLLTQREFAWLYYPDHPYSRPPYEMPPEIAWLQYQANGTQGWEQLRDRYLGRRVRYAGHACDGSASRWNGNREWTKCVVDLVVDARDTVRAQLFGSIVERDGRHKFVTFANKL